jgi:2,3-bisphosphoglycerate-dependent phosphoglycerate mutase
VVSVERLEGLSLRSTIILVRHCESSGQAPEAPLTAKGFDDARELAQRLATLGVEAVYSSPYARAVQTIEPFAARQALPINIEPRLRERLLSAEALDDWLDHVRLSFDNLDHRAPGGETLREAQMRGLAALQRVFDDGAASAAVVSHGNLLSSLLHRMDPRFGFEAWRAMPNPALYRVQLQHGVPVTFEVLSKSG